MYALRALMLTFRGRMLGNMERAELEKLLAEFTAFIAAGNTPMPENEELGAAVALVLKYKFGGNDGRA